jgi:maltose alpha-D-glucosyltransferase/alpha-amylase
MLSDPLDPLFAPTGYTVFYQRALFQTMQRNINEAFIKLKKLKTYQDMHPFREKLIKYMEKFTRTSFRVERIRLHGNYILENLYFSGKEFFITNFGGNPTLSFAERKYKRSPLRDIAAMLVSIGEASFEALDKIKLRGQVPSHSIDRFEEWALLWSAYIGSTFLRAYLRKAEEHPFMLLDKKEIDFLIGIFFLEKCGEKIIQSENHINTYCVLIKHWLQIYEATEST